MHRVFIIESTVNRNFVTDNLRSKSPRKINCVLSPGYLSNSLVHASATASDQISLPLEY